MGAMTLLNEMGDTTIEWTPSADAMMAELIAKKMAEGVTFFIVTREDERRKFTRRDLAAVKKGAETAPRKLVLPDEDVAKVVEAGKAALVPTPEEKVATSRVSRDAAEVARSKSVGVRPMRGG